MKAGRQAGRDGIRFTRNNSRLTAMRASDDRCGHLTVFHSRRYSSGVIFPIRGTVGTQGAPDGVCALLAAGACGNAETRERGNPQGAAPKLTL